MTNTTKTATQATGLLTQKELFRLYLDAPRRTVCRSTLLEPKVIEGTVLDDTGLCDVPGVLQTSQTLQDALEQIADKDDVEFELEELATTLGDVSRFLLSILNEFRDVASELRIPEPSEGAPKDVWDKWENNPRYLYPQQIAEAARLSMLAEDWFDDAVETYHDFSKNHTRSELRRACKAVSNELSDMPETSKIFVINLLDDHKLSDEWEHKNMRYCDAARLLLPKLEGDEPVSKADH